MDLDLLSKCPICYELIKEPVKFPCEHEICLSCFEKSLEAANHCCPLCRKRISSWARKNAKNPVCTKRKRKIEEVLTTYNVLLDPVRADESTSSPRHLSKPGEIREDYLAELQKVQEERSLEESMSEEEARKLQLKIDTEHRERERLGEAVARSIEQEEQKRKLDNIRQKEYDKQMAEVLSQEFILREIESRRKQLERDQNLARKLSESSDDDTAEVDCQPVKKMKLDSHSYKPITFWLQPLSSKASS